MGSARIMTIKMIMMIRSDIEGRISFWGSVRGGFIFFLIRLDLQYRVHLKQIKDWQKVAEIKLD
jgi:hypothetical protein